MPDETTCFCGHEEDEHDESGTCQVSDCRCFAYEADPAGGFEDE
jgi:hypothetical protein